MPQPYLLITTADGSHSLSLPDSNVTFHSRHGALQESTHVFLQTGLLDALTRFETTELRVFEMGFGTGLNALLTAKAAEELRRQIYYQSIDTDPLPAAQWQGLNYGVLTGQEALWEKICLAPWNKATVISPYFTLLKEKKDLLAGRLENGYHLIYFDAFSPEMNPELWTEAIFEKLFRHTLPGGCLVTYCSKSIVRKAMEKGGWQVKKLPGPYGKREIARAVRC